jgi:HD superfamily phosphohydrolase
VDFILSRLHPNPERGIDIDSRAIPSVESVLFSKYLMYRTVYWHPSVRSATAMIKKALLGGLEKGLIAQEELYDLDDQSLFALMKNRSDPLFALGDKVRDGRLYTTVAEFPYNKEFHQDLLDITNHSRYEGELAEACSEALGIRILPEELIIDIPEPITFETGLYVTDEGRCFEQSSSVFKAEMVDSFIKSLHTIRIFIDPIHKKWFHYDPERDGSKKCNFQLYDILHSQKKWL